MHWTTELPREAGWYWFESKSLNIAPRIVHVIDDTGSLMVDDHEFQLYDAVDAFVGANWSDQPVRDPDTARIEPAANSAIPSVVGRLLREVSWEGNARHYRQAGRGFENVLTGEVLQTLDFLPRSIFFAAVLRACHGAPDALQRLVSEIEEATLSVLPGDTYLQGSDIPKVSVQPDAFLTSPSVYGVVEAKRIGSNSFQEMQLAREYVLAQRSAGERRPLLLLLLSSPPPVLVHGRGRLTLRSAIAAGLPYVFDPQPDIGSMLDEIDETVTWITWIEIADVVRASLGGLPLGGPLGDASVARIATSLVHAIHWHSALA